MRQVDDHAWRHLPHRLDDSVVRGRVSVVPALEHRRRWKQRQAIADLDQHAVEENVIEPFGRTERVRHALRRLLVEIQRKRAERKVEIDNRRVNLQLIGNAPAHIVRQRRRTSAPPCAHEGDDTADGLRLAIDIKAGDRLDQVERIERGNEIFTDAAAHKFPIELDIVDAADAKAVLFTSNRGTNFPPSNELYCVPVAGGQVKRVSAFEGKDGVFSPLGDLIAYVRGPGTACNPPSWTSRWALARRRSAAARCRAAPVSGNSQKAEIEIRGTGRSWGAAPNGSLPLPGFPTASA